MTPKCLLNVSKLQYIGIIGSNWLSQFIKSAAGTLLWLTYSHFMI